MKFFNSSTKRVHFIQYKLFANKFNTQLKSNRKRRIRDVTIERNKREKNKQEHMEFENLRGG